MCVREAVTRGVMVVDAVRIAACVVRGARRRVKCSEVYPVERGPVSFEREGNENVCFMCDDGNVYTRLCFRDVLTMG